MRRTLMVGALACALGSGCGGDAAAPTTEQPVVLLTGTVNGVGVSPTSVTMHVGEQFRLSAGVSASGGPISSYNVYWSSDNPAIAAVADTGVVSANALGTTFITAASAVNPSVTGTATIKVIPPGAPLNARAQAP